MSAAPDAGGAAAGAAAGAGGDLPLIVLAGGRVAAVTRTDAKGWAKSLAEGRLWALHPQTCRLLPLELPGKLLRLEERSGFYEAEMEGETLPEEAVPAAAAEAGGPAAAPDVLARLAALVARRRKELPAGSYTTHLFTEGAGKIRKKLGEEAVELILARGRDELVFEAADLLYHLLVLLEDAGVGLDQVLAELERRHQAG